MAHFRDHNPNDGARYVPLIFPGRSSLDSFLFSCLLRHFVIDLSIEFITKTSILIPIQPKQEKRLRSKAQSIVRINRESRHGRVYYRATRDV